MLRSISSSTMVDLGKVTALRSLSEGRTILHCGGFEYETSIYYDILLQLINEEKERPIPTTNPSQFAG